MSHSSQRLAALALGCALFAPAARAVNPSYSDTLLIPQRAIIVSGNLDTPLAGEHVAVLYSREDLSYNDPSAPRFLFLDREGKIALGIGGYVLGITEYDFDGAINNLGFDTYNIPAPNTGGMDQQLQGDVSHTSLFLKLVTHDRLLGHISIYVQGNFSGGSSYGFKLKQAYATVGHVTMGLAHSTFVDASTQAPTIDYAGPSGEITDKNILLRYKTSTYGGFSGAVALELPQATFTFSPTTAKIPQRIPDLPLYVQYGWRKSHVRLSGIVRGLSYRDVSTAKNRIVNGWGLHLSSDVKLNRQTAFFGHVAYGRGIATYVNDLAGNGFDLVPDSDGHMIAPGTLGWTAGANYRPVGSVLLSASYSQARLYDTEHLPGSTYRSGQYATMNVFYNFTSDLQVGAQYIWGRRSNRDNTSGHANRILASLQYSF